MSFSQVFYLTIFSFALTSTTSQPVNPPSHINTGTPSPTNNHQAAFRPNPILLPQDSGLNPLLDDRIQHFCDELSLLPFVGTWEIDNTNSQTPFEGFHQTQGKIQFNFNDGFILKNRLVWYEEPIYTLNVSQTAQVIVIDGTFNDDYLFFINFENVTCENFNVSTGIFYITASNIPINAIQQCDITLQIDLNNVIMVETNEVYTVDESGTINLKMHSTNCNINLLANLHRDTYNYHAKMVSEILFQGVILLASFFTNMKLIRGLFRFTTESNRISLLVPVYIAIWDLIFLINMNIFADLRNFEITLILFCIESALFMFSSILLLSVPMMRKTQNMSMDITAADFLKTSLQYGVPPIVAMVVFITVSEQAFFNTTFLFLINLYLLPQIIHNVVKGAPVTFDPQTIAYIVGLRPLSPLYLKGCPSNLFNISTSGIFIIGLMFCLALQVFVLYLQAKRGVRFFIPRCILASDHNYFQDLPDDTNQGTELKPLLLRMCNICMGNLSERSNFAEITNPDVKDVLTRLKVRPESTMRTECGHKFHTACLVEWMMVKMECPVCKITLRAIE